MNPSGRMGVGLLGDSVAGGVVASALAGAGHALIGRSVPPEDRADHVEALLPGVPVLDVADIVRRSELLLIAATGEALVHLLDAITGEELIQPGQIAILVTDNESIGSLSALSQRGVITLALCPLLPLTGHSLDVWRVRGAWCGVIATTPVAPIGQALAVEMGMETVVVTLDQEQAFLHAVSLATASATELVNQVVAPLTTAGIDDAMTAFQALMHHTIDHMVALETDRRIERGSLVDADFDVIVGNLDDPHSPEPR